ncbi:hemin uptake protein HemP [Dyella psychrodurans]|uniref:Hemin uptake protein HemP n=2 Tax=Dyella psychrodurans TaxID=1927960 RepID=A0A370X2F3_9GAMM|nr:hemin uptake protein HemP [Dyella psychrodurans]
MSASTLTLSRPTPPPMLPTTDTVPVTPVRRISSQRLLAGERELVIQHLGSEYHLRLTRNGKLILTK